MTPDQHQSNIEKLEKKLYSPNATFDDPNNRRHLREKNYDLDKSWEDENTVIDVPMKKSYIFQIFLGISIFFFVIASGYAIYKFNSSKNTYSDDHITMDISGPITVGGGDPLKLDVHVVNNNTVPLKAVDLVVKYPNGTKNAEDLTQDLDTSREGMGDISSGGLLQKSLSAVLFGEENEKKQIQITLEYQVPNSDAIFEKTKTYEVVLSGSPVRVTVDSLKEIQSNQDAQLLVTVSSNSNNTLKNVLVRTEYPFGFTFKSADPAPTSDTNVWDLGDLKPQETRKIIVKGKMEGQNEEERVFKVYTGIKDPNNEKQVGVLLARGDYSMTIQKPFLGIDLAVNGEKSQDVVVTSGQPIPAALFWNNNLSTILNNVEIDAKLTGAALDRSSVRVDGGFYRSLDNTLVWTSETYPIFAQLNSGDSGRLGFNFATFPNVSDTQQLLKNPQLDLVINVKGTRVSDNNVPQEINSSITKHIKVMTDVSVTGKSNYTDGPFKNTGPNPSKQEQETTYTTSLKVTNTVNAVTNARIVGQLPSYVSWKNVVSPTNEKVTYDEVTRQLVWSLGDVAPGVGYSLDAKTMYMQVGFVPSVSQIGSSPDLVNQLYFEGVDTFTGRVIRQQIRSITINTEDTNEVSGHGRVSE